jgi:cytidylate kinase
MAVITISRQFGAGGKTLGKMIADNMGYSLVDEDIIEKVAQEYNVSEENIKSIEQEAGGNILDYIGRVSPWKRFMDRSLTDKEGYIDGFKYVELLYKIIGKIADEGNVVIVGRGGQYVLQTYPSAFHFLFIANRDDRIKFIQDRYEMSYTKAVSVVQNMEKRRANLYRYYRRKDYNSLNLYHMTLNMSLVSIEKARDLVSRLVKTATGSGGTP